jgi:tight adherence protein C
MGEVSEITLYTLAAGGSVFCFVLCLLSFYADYIEERRLRRPLAEAEQAQKRVSPLFVLLLPLARFFGHLIASYIARLERQLGPKSALPIYMTKIRLRLQKSLLSAGSPEGLTADEMLGLILLSIVAWTVFGVIVAVLLGTSFVVLVAMVWGVAQPLLWLKGKIARRTNEIRKLLPYALDLLTLSVEAGLDFAAALDRMVPKLAGTALAEEFGEMLRALRLGKSRPEALRDMAARVNVSEVTSFCSSLVQAVELGADLGPVLRILADQMRNDRSNRAEKKAMEAPVKILFPLIAFIFPTVFLLLFGSIGIKYIARLLTS